MLSPSCYRIFFKICIVCFAVVGVFGTRNARHTVTGRANITRAQIDKIVEDHIKMSGLPAGDARRLSTRFMMQIYEKVTNLGQNLLEATGHNKMADKMAAMKPDTIRTLSAKVDAGRLRSREELDLMFDISGIDLKERIQLAELRVKASRRDRHLVTHYRILARITSKGRCRKKRKFTIGAYRDEIDGFRVLDITAVVDRMRRYVKGENDVLELSLRSRRSTRKRENKTKRRYARYVDTQEAMLLILSEEKDFLKQHLNRALAKASIAKRKRRNAAADNKHGKSRHRAKQNWKRAKKKGRPCAKFDFHIDFEEIGWGKWIIFPKEFNARLCVGSCPSPVTQEHDPTNHAVMQSIMQTKDQTIPEPCCVPTELKPLSFLYLDPHGGIVMRSHEDMVAETCGCR